MSSSQVIRCPKCGASNRVSSGKVEKGFAPVCGRCKAVLPTHAGPIVVTDASFTADVERSPLPVLLDLWAPWCGPCRMIAPIIEKLAARMGSQIRFAKLNIDQNPHTAARFNVQSIPTLLVLKKGREVDRIVGAQPESEIARRLTRFSS